MTIRSLSIESRTSNTLCFCALFIPAISLAIDMFFHQWSNRVCWYLKVLVNQALHVKGLSDTTLRADVRLCVQAVLIFVFNCN